MKYFLMITTIWSISVAGQDLCIQGYIHQRGSFYVTDVKPFSAAAVDHVNGILYYAAIPDESTNKSISLNSHLLITHPDKEGGHIFDFKDIQELYVDRYTSHLYILANTDYPTNTISLYKYDGESVKMIEKIDVPGRGESIFQFFAIKNQLYWVDVYHHMYRYNNGRIGKHNNKLNAYHEDMDGALYFIKYRDDNYVYKVKKGEREQLRFVSTNLDYFEGFRTDAKGKVYAVSVVSDKLYDISEEEGKLVPASDKLPITATYVHFDHVNDIIWVDRSKNNYFGKLTKTLKACQYAT